MLALGKDPQTAQPLLEREQAHLPVHSPLCSTHSGWKKQTLFSLHSFFHFEIFNYNVHNFLVDSSTSANVITLSIAKQINVEWSKTSVQIIQLDRMCVPPICELQKCDHLIISWQSSSPVHQHFHCGHIGNIWLTSQQRLVQKVESVLLYRLATLMASIPGQNKLDLGVIQEIYETQCHSHQWWERTVGFRGTHVWQLPLGNTARVLPRTTRSNPTRHRVGSPSFPNWWKWNLYSTL